MACCAGLLRGLLRGLQSACCASALLSAPSPSPPHPPCLCALQDIATLTAGQQVPQHSLYATMDTQELALNYMNATVTPGLMP